MSDVDERGPERPAEEFARVAEFAQRGSALATPEQIRVLGLRRLHRRRAGQAVLGTGALAAVVFLTAGFVQNGSGRPIELGAAGAGGSAAVSSPAVSKAPSTAASRPKEFMFPESVTGSSGSAVAAQLRRVGYKNVTVKSIPNAMVPTGKAVDIEDGQGHSLLGQVVHVSTPVTVVVSAGPSPN